MSRQLSAELRWPSWPRWAIRTQSARRRRAVARRASMSGIAPAPIRTPSPYPLPAGEGTRTLRPAPIGPPADAAFNLQPSTASAASSGVAPDQPVRGHLADVLDRLGPEAPLDHGQVGRAGEVAVEGRVAEAQHLGGREVLGRQRQRVDRVLGVAEPGVR